MNTEQIAKTIARAIDDRGAQTADDRQKIYAAARTAFNRAKPSDPVILERAIASVEAAHRISRSDRRRFSGKRIEALDGLRGLAAYLVVLSHVTVKPMLFGGLFIGTGSQAVAIFFTLSGFLMAHIYFQREMTAASITEFYIRRIARVVPIYLFIVILSYVTFAVWGSAFPLFDVTDDNLLGHLTFTYGISVLWTIPTEVQFYAIFPVFWLAARHFKEASVLIFLATIAIVAWLGFPGQPSIMGGFIFFLAGASISFVSMKKSSAADIVLVFFLLTILFSTESGRQIFGMAPINLRYHPSLLIVLPLTVFATMYSPLANVILGSRIARKAGEISFSVYLTHVPVYWTIVATGLLDNMPYMRLVIVLIMTTVVSMATVALIEKPCRGYINKLVSSNSPPYVNSIACRHRNPPVSDPLP